MKVTIVVKEEHADLLNKASIGSIDPTSPEFKVDWAPYSGYAKGFLTVQIDYDLYVQLSDLSDFKI